MKPEMPDHATEPRAREQQHKPPAREASLAAGPFSPDQLREFVAAKARSTKLRRAASVATFGGWTTAVFSGLTILTGFLSPSAILLGIGMAVVSFNEFRGSAMLKRFDARAPRRLALNQLAFGAMLVAYGLWCVVAALSGPVISAPHTGEARVDAMLGDIGRLERTLSIAVSLVVAAFGVVGPGLAAWYYFTRAGAMRTFLRATPPWTVELMRAAA
jgi:hypothetical protein